MMKALFVPFGKAEMLALSHKHTNYCSCHGLRSDKLLSGRMKKRRFGGGPVSAAPSFPFGTLPSPREGVVSQSRSLWRLLPPIQCPSSLMEKGQAPDLNSANGSVYPGTLDSLK